MLKDLSNLGHGLVGLAPVAGSDEVFDGREQVAVVARPQLRSEYDVLELRASGDLYSVSRGQCYS